MQVAAGARIPLPVLSSHHARRPLLTVPAVSPPVSGSTTGTSATLPEDGVLDRQQNGATTRSPRSSHPPKRPPSAPVLFGALLRPDRPRGLGRLADGLAQTGWDVRQQPHGVLVAGGSEADPRAAIGTSVEIAQAVFGAVRCRWQPMYPSHCVVIVPERSVGAWELAVHAARAGAERHGAVVVARSPVVGVDALRALYAEAVLDLALVQRISVGEALFLPADLAEWRMLARLDDEERQRLTAPVAPIVGLRPVDAVAYLRTIEVLFVCEGSFDHASEFLHVHPNAVRYRSRRIEELTGLSMRTPRGAFQLILGARLMRLTLAAPAPPPPLFTPQPRALRRRR